MDFNNLLWQYIYTSYLRQFTALLCLTLFHILQQTQGVSRLEDTTAGNDFLGLCDQESSYKHVSEFGRLRSYGHF